MSNFTYTYDNGERPQNHVTRKRITIVGGILAVTLGLTLLGREVVLQQQTGRLRVTTGQDGTEILLRESTGPVDIDTPSTQALTKTRNLGKGSVDARLEPGSYQVLVKKDGAVATAPVTIDRGKTADLELATRPLIKAESLAVLSARDILPLADGLNYLDSITGTVNNYNYSSKQSTPLPQFASTYDRDSTVSQVRWLSPSGAYFRRGDGNGGWQFTGGGAPQAVRLPNGGLFRQASFSSAGNRASFARNWQVFAMDGPTTPARQIASMTSNTVETIASSDGKVAIRELSLEPLEEEHEHEEGEDVAGEHNHNHNIVRIYDNGTLSSPKELKGASRLLWSPDGGKLAFTGEDGGSVYDTRTKKVTPITRAQETFFLDTWWLNADTLVYREAGALWQHELTSGITHKLLSHDGTLYGTQSLTVAEDGRSIYFCTAVDQKGNGGYVYRADLR